MLLAPSLSSKSWRIYLSCALLEAGASSATICTMLRWRSEDALKLYARMNDNKYADWLARASQANVSNIRTTTLADHMNHVGSVDGIQVAAFSDAWLRLAATSKDAHRHKNTIPATDVDALYAELRSSASELHRLAAIEDDSMCSAPLLLLHPPTRVGPTGDLRSWDWAGPARRCRPDRPPGLPGAVRPPLWSGLIPFGPT